MKQEAVRDTTRLCDAWSHFKGVTYNPGPRSLSDKTRSTSEVQALLSLILAGSAHKVSLSVKWKAVLSQLLSHVKWRGIYSFSVSVSLARSSTAHCTGLELPRRLSLLQWTDLRVVVKPRSACSRKLLKHSLLSARQKDTFCSIRLCISSFLSSFSVILTFTLTLSCSAKNEKKPSCILDLLMTAKSKTMDDFVMPFTAPD